jgi:hypothetical protein
VTLAREAWVYERMIMRLHARTSRRRRRLRHLVYPALLAVLSSCGRDPHTGPHAPKTISIESGDAQFGAATAPLHLPLVVRVLDEHSEPVSGAVVHWSTGDGGELSPPESETNDRGFARTTWTLGAAAGRQHAHAVVEQSGSADFAADAQTEDVIISAPVTLPLTTPDASGQTVHPDYVAMPASWPAFHQYLLITPYPGGNSGYENPSIFADKGSLTWEPPEGVTNPIARPLHGYLSDPDVVAVPETNELWVYYREVLTHNEVYVTRSKDGVTFTAPRLVVSADNHDIVSPTVVHRGPSDWMMWAVKSGSGCGAASTSVELRRSTNGLDWSSPEKVALDQGNGYSPWHIDVQWIPSRNEFWAVFNGKTAGSCTTPALFIATSPDGVTWKTHRSPIAVRGISPDLADVVYRSTFKYDEDSDAIDFWYSGATYDTVQYVWRTVYQRRTRGEVFATAAKKSAAGLASIASRKGVPPLLNAP